MVWGQMVEEYERRHTICESPEDDDGEYGLNGADGEDEYAIIETHLALLLCTSVR